jgi:hypothetical protein
MQSGPSATDEVVGRPRHLAQTGAPSATQDKFKPSAVQDKFKPSAVQDKHQPTAQQIKVEGVKNPSTTTIKRDPPAAVQHKMPTESGMKPK